MADLAVRADHAQPTQLQSTYTVSLWTVVVLITILLAVQAMTVCYIMYKRTVPDADSGSDSDTDVYMASSVVGGAKKPVYHNRPGCGQFKKNTPVKVSLCDWCKKNE